MFIRSELKQKAKQSIHRNILLCIGVTLVYSLLTSGWFGVNFDVNTNLFYFRMGLGATDALSFDFIYIPISAAVFALFSLLSIAYNVFISSPLTIGHVRYYLENRIEKSRFETLFSPFKKGEYLNVVKITLLRDIYLLLWSLPAIIALLLSAYIGLFYNPSFLSFGILAIFLLIPVLMKSYEYSMIPYILAENPIMDSSDVFAMTKVLTKGEKLNLFVLDLSFILWMFLGILTFGIALFYVNAYVLATTCEAYIALKEGNIENGNLEVEDEENESEEIEYVNPTIDDLH